MSAQEIIGRALARLPMIEHTTYREMADAVLAALTAAGLMVVPREPTEAIIRAAAQLDWSAQTDPTWREFYAVMIAAAQEPQG